MEALSLRVSELTGQVSRLEGAKVESVARMEEALSREAGAETRAEAAVKAEGDTRAEIAVSYAVLCCCCCCLCCFRAVRAVLGLCCWVAGADADAADGDDYYAAADVIAPAECAVWCCCVLF